jgi:hypothetical protein
MEIVFFFGMKTYPMAAGFRRCAARLLLRGGGLALAGLGLNAGLAADRAPPPDTAKPFMLYMGADIDLKQDAQFYRVRDVADRSFVIAPKDQRVIVPVTGRDSVSFKIAKSLKLSDKVIQVSDLKAERGYTPGADPFRKFAQQAGNAAAASDEQNAAAVRMAEAATSLSMAQANAARNPGMPNTVGNASEQLNSYANQMQASGAAAASEFNNIGAFSDKLGNDAAAEAYDAVEVTMYIASDKPLSHPYLIVIAQYREKGGKPGVVSNWLYATELDAITEVPRRIRIKQGGFPPGFELVKHEVHFYNQGQEVANTTADKAVTLTRDEAHEYIVIDHLASHKGATLPPTLALGAKSGDFRTRYGGEQLQRTIYVKVNKDGLPQGIFGNQACTEKIDDPFMESVVSYARFKPALQAGKAVDGVAGVRLGELAL